MHLGRFTIFPFLFLLALIPNLAVAADSGPGSAETAVPANALIQPADLAAMLQDGKTAPIILQVGFSVLYAEAHIPGAQYAGPTSKVDGIQNLKARVVNLPHDKLIVLYCGCCPWTRCPNIAPAYLQLHAMGFSNLRVLYLANNFGDDWVSKGYPVIRGS